MATGESLNTEKRAEGASVDAPSIWAGAPLEVPCTPLLQILSQLAQRELETSEAANNELPPVVVSRYFSPRRQEQFTTFTELYRDILRMAQGYRCLGLGQGSKIALAETNSLDFFSSYFGGLAIGATMVPVNLLAMQDESTKIKNLAHMLSTPKLNAQDKPGVDAFVYGSDSMLAGMAKLGNVLKLKKSSLLRSLLGTPIKNFAQEKAPRGLEHLLFPVLARRAKTAREKADLGILFQSLPATMRLVSPEDKRALMRQGEGEAFVAMPEEQACADIVFTSGTSGSPKGVALTHGNLAFTVASLTQGTLGVIRDQDVLLMGLPFFHIFGKAVLLTALSRQLEVSKTGGRVRTILLPSLSKAVQSLDSVIKTIHEYQVTILPAVPVFLEKLADYLTRHPDKIEMIRSLRIIISGGAALKGPVYEAYRSFNENLTVMEGYGSTEAGINLLNTVGAPGFVGGPMPGVETRLLEKGELQLRSPGVSKGYVAGTTGGGSLTVADEDGWFSSGDIVRRDSDHGYKIMGRESFFIKIDNEKRSPEELEEAIQLAVPQVKDAMVVAYHAGAMHAEKAVAVVVTPDTSVNEESIRKAMLQLAQKSFISKWKIPRHILVLHLEKMPSRFDNGFKRESGYKIIREFIQELLRAPDGSANSNAIVAFHDKTETSKWEWTEILDANAFHRMVERYDTSSEALFKAWTPEDKSQ